MKNKLITLLLLTVFVLTSCGNPNSSGENPNNTNSELDALGNVEVDKNLFSVKLTIPADYVGESTQEELDKVAKEKGYKSITLNEDGSATYVMTKAQHKKLMDETKNSIINSLDEMVNSEEYPNFTDISVNDDFTEFTITTKSTELDISESFSSFVFYMYGGMYHIFNGTQVDNISLTYINADSGEVISTANSSDMSE